MDIKTLGAVRFQFAQAVFTHKIQEIAAERKYGYAAIIKRVQLVLTGLVIAILAGQALGISNVALNVAGIIFAALDLMFVIFDLTYGFEKQAANHKAYAIKYLDLRTQYQTLIADIMATKGKSKENDARRDAINKAYLMLSDAPQTTDSDYSMAQKRLNTDGSMGEEQFTWSDTEIDRFLPVQLRIVKPVPGKTRKHR